MKCDCFSSMCYDHLKKTQAQRRKFKKKRGVKDTADNLLGQLDKYAVKNPSNIDPIQESLAKKVLGKLDFNLCKIR